MAAIDDRALLEVFEYGLDDWISFETVARILSRFVEPPEEKLCAETSRCISVLVAMGWFRPGVLQDPEGFVELTRPLPEVLTEVCVGWSLTDPRSWAALWLELTDEGRSKAMGSFPEITDDVGTYLDRRVVFDVFASGLADRISLATIADALRDRLEVFDTEICAEVRRYVVGLVVEGWFRAGAVEASGFVPLAAPLDELLAALCERWDGADQERWGSAVWLELTDEGRAEALRRFPGLDD